jgi:hypothetical protein
MQISIDFANCSPSALARLALFPDSASAPCVCRTAPLESVIPISTVSSPLARLQLQPSTDNFCMPEGMLWEASIRGKESQSNSDLLLAPLVAAQKVAVTGKASVRTHVSETDIRVERVCPLAKLTKLDLTGVAIAETIKGIQDAGVIACAKHYIGNEQVC